MHNEPLNSRMLDILHGPIQWRIQEIGKGFQRPHTITRILAKEIANCEIETQRYVE